MNNKTGVTLLLLGAAAAVSVNANEVEEYVNPCVEFDTAKKLNDLFYDTPTSNTGEEEERPSYYSSGLFVHGQDAGGGTDLSFAVTTPVTPGTV